MRKQKRFITGNDIPYRKDSEGKSLCRWCGIAVKPPRRTWCSKACVHEYSMRSSASYVRARVKERDKGVCAGCGWDTLRTQRILGIARQRFSFYLWPDSPAAWVADHLWARFAGFVYERSGLPMRRSFWEADHILEIVNDGDSTMENLQTLCVMCHKQKTARLQTERARTRRDAKRGLLDGAVNVLSA